MRHAVALLLAAVVMLVATPHTVAAPVPKGVKKRPDAEVFVGTWELAEGNNGGVRYAWTFDADLTMWSKPAGSDGPGTKWAIRIDPEKSPKEIDLTSGSTSYKGIYEIDGDEIRMVYSGSRPANFDDKARTNYTVLRRADKK